MKLFIDSADIEKIRNGFDYYPLCGVTTNPTIIARDIGDGKIKDLLKEIRKLSGDRLMFVQAIEGTADEMVRDAHAIVNYLGGNLSIKIPVGQEGVKAIKILERDGISSTATAVYTVSQALTAAEAGADFAAPYITHIDNLCLDGPAEASKMAAALKTHGFRTEVLAASFRTLSQVSRCFEGGVTSATVTYEMLCQMVSHPGTSNELASFATNWNEKFGKMRMEELLGN